MSPTALRAVVLDHATLAAWRRARAANASAPLHLDGAIELPCDTANAEALTSALSQLRRTLRSSGPVILGLPTTSAIVSTLSPLIPAPKRAALAVQFELQQQLPFELMDAAWHYQPLARTNGTASAPVLAAAVRRSLLEERLRCCQRAGMAVSAVSLGALADLNVWKFLHDAPSAAILHALAPQAAEWIVWAEGRVHVTPVFSASADAFSQELALSWETLRAEHPHATVHVLGSDELAGTAQDILRRAEASVERLIVPVTPVAGQPIDTMTALGLALQGAGAAAVPINLVALRQEEARVQRLRRLALWTSGICGALTIGLLLGGMLQLRHERVVVLQALEERQRRYQALRPEIRSALQDQEQLEERLRQLDQLINESAGLTRLLAQVAEALPQTVWLTKIEWSKTSTLPGAARGGHLIEGVLEGRARSFQDATQLLERLKTVPGMMAVRSISATPTIDAATGKEFIAFAVQLQQALQPMTDR
ncbi:MAG: hypothetical protein COV75_04475 [Candidatus Omnitrophica bacterium CG11_big_fil_rev_8_21_14_0_20_63_9]|nr:MAG: hypothetical protein COV75_04475 [Candidatus Omnitrophica bacterium CG11_big_fil_rev_8_21_14_0_20_63_9]